MSKQRLILTIVFGLGSLASFSPSVLAQAFALGRTARDNNAAAGARAPGAMVSAGIAAAQQAAQDGRAIHAITETLDTSDAADDGSGATTAFTATLSLEDQITANILGFVLNRILEQLGLPSLFGTGSANGSADNTDTTAGTAPDNSAGGADPVVPPPGDTTTPDPTDTTGSGDITTPDTTGGDTGGRRPGGGRGGRG